MSTVGEVLQPFRLHVVLNFLVVLCDGGGQRLKGHLNGDLLVVVELLDKAGEVAVMVEIETRFLIVRSDIAADDLYVIAFLERDSHLLVTPVVEEIVA